MRARGGRATKITAGREGESEAAITFRLALHAAPGLVLNAGALTAALGPDAAEVPAAGAACGAWRIEAPEAARLHWPALPFNSYRQDSQSPLETAYIVLSCPVGTDPRMEQRTDSALGASRRRRGSTLKGTPFEPKPPCVLECLRKPLGERRGPGLQNVLLSMCLPRKEEGS